MSFDGVFTHNILKELNHDLLGGRISKIHQPYQNEIILIIRSNGKNLPLLLSAHPSYARLQITLNPYQNPDSPPTFCMMLRKYIEGAILEKIEQIENDRIIQFYFTKRNELGDLENIVLIVELMGRHSTIVLVNRDSNRILDCIKHIGPSQNSYRTLLPGSEYLRPPKPKGVNPYAIDQKKLFELLSTLPEITARSLQQAFQGLGRDTAEELAYLLNLHPNDKMKTWESFWDRLENQPLPTLTENELKSFFSPLPYETLNGEQTTFSSCSLLLDAYYHGKADKDRVHQQTADLVRRLDNELKKNRQKISKLEKSLAETENAEDYRKKGELLTTFMNQVTRGASEIALPDYYMNDQLISIKLNPALSPGKNAQKYFHKYQKLKKSVAIIKQQVEKTEQEIAYLESLLSQIDLATPKDMLIIREELLQQGFIREKINNAKKRRKPYQSLPAQYQSSDGVTMWVGRNNLQNDQLTLKKAKKNDTWLHAKNIPGSHVVIESANPSEETLYEAANLAAYFSKYRLSASVPVDYTQIRYIHKPNGARPGYVIYENQKTLFCTPDAELIKKLEVSEK